MEMNTAFSLLYIDVDLLASINERYGRALGDRLLGQIGDRLRAVAPSRHILVRLLDDEFMLLTAGDAERLSRIAQRLLASVRYPITIDGQVLEASISIGAALQPPHGEDILALMRHAELAMRQVKAQGRNGYQLFGAQ